MKPSTRYRTSHPPGRRRILKRDSPPAAGVGFETTRDLYDHCRFSRPDLCAENDAEVFKVERRFWLNDAVFNGVCALRRALAG
jgi:hypothetical protein